MDESQEPLVIAQRDPSYQRVYKNFVKDVTNNRVQVNNAVDVVRSLTSIVDSFSSLDQEGKKKLIIKTLEDIVSGNDGILYTDDDLLPRHVLEGLEVLIRTDVILSIIELAMEITQTKASTGIICYLFRFLSYLLCCPCTRCKKNKSMLSISTPAAQ
jgi:hypothetical protein